MNKPGFPLMLRLFWIYAGVALFGTVLISLNNLFINSFSWEELIRFNLKAKLLIALLMIISFLLYSYLRLKAIFHRMDDVSKDVEMTWNRLLLLPHEVFAAMLIFGVFVSPTYHIIDLWLLKRPIFLWIYKDLLIFLRDFLFDQSLTLTLAVLLYSLLRYHLRPYLIQLSVIKLNRIEWKASFLRPLLLAFISVLLITIFSMAGYVINSIVFGNPIHLTILFSIAFVAFLFGVCLFLLLAKEFMHELQVMIRSIHSLIGGERIKLHQKIPVISKDEVGQLAYAFNELQDYVARQYADLEYELHLAYQVQRSLLPQENQRIGGCHIVASCQSMKEVGGDLYDIYIIDKDRFAVLIGDVSGKGISAALLMSAVIHLFKMEMERGGSAGQILTRLNRLMVETLRGERYITLGLAIIDMREKTASYASAGHVAPYYIRDGKVEQVLLSSLPAGIAKDEAYSEITIPFAPNDQFVFYTDGLIEKLDEQGEFIGFDRFEQFLQKLEHTDHLERQFHVLRQWLGEGSTAKYEDDRTLIMARWTEHA